MGAHPRSRGENSIVVGMVREGMGSSPLTRGKRERHRNARLGLGLIPAHAGKTPPHRLHRNAPRAHPRSRGENRHRAHRRDQPHGSSPLTRGKHERDRADARRCRLIPAHAGKTVKMLTMRSATGAHPRSRGENCAGTGGRARRAGSSPLTRGKRPHPRHRLPVRRLIPAHAGKTGSPAEGATPCWAHPRSRGENRSPSGVRVGLGGSSPLTRGKPDTLLGRHLHPGLIPAHAGKT